MKIDMYQNKLTRFIGRQCYLMGAYSGNYDESCGQVVDNIKKYGILAPFKCYYYNSNLYHWLHRYTNNDGKKVTLNNVTSRIFHI